LKHCDCVENHKYVPWHIPNIQLDAGLNLTKVVNSSCLTFSKICNQTDSLNNHKCTALTLSWNIDKKWFSCRFECHFVYLWFFFKLCSFRNNFKMKSRNLSISIFRVHSYGLEIVGEWVMKIPKNEFSLAYIPHRSWWYVCI
jgi:hypothetical protein